MVINAIDTRRQKLTDIKIISTDDGIQALFISNKNNTEMMGLLRTNATYPSNFHPSDEFKDKVCRELSSKYKHYWKTGNNYSLQSDLDDMIAEEIDGFDNEIDEYSFEED